MITVEVNVCFVTCVADVQYYITCSNRQNCSKTRVEVYSLYYSVPLNKKNIWYKSYKMYEK
jgi:hypothetical protein